MKILREKLSSKENEGNEIANIRVYEYDPQCHTKDMSKEQILGEEYKGETKESRESIYDLVNKLRLKYILLF